MNEKVFKGTVPPGQPESGIMEKDINRYRFFLFFYFKKQKDGGFFY
jgi:hypothetical protein